MIEEKKILTTKNRGAMLHPSPKRLGTRAVNWMEKLNTLYKDQIEQLGKKMEITNQKYKETLHIYARGKGKGNVDIKIIHVDCYQRTSFNEGFTPDLAREILKCLEMAIKDAEEREKVIPDEDDDD